MGVVKCPKCRNVYEFIGLPPRCCPICFEKEKAEFEIIRNYIRTNPGANVQIVSGATEIPVKKVLQYVRDDWFSVMKHDENSFVRCSNCGKPIMSGDLCTECKQKTPGFLLKNIVK